MGYYGTCSFPSVSTIFTTILVLVLILEQCNCYLKYTEQSCADLVPRNTDQYKETDYSQFFGYGSQLKYPGKRKRADYDDIPYRLSVTGKRYRRNSDLIVRIEGGDFEGLMIQARIIAGGELLRGGVGLVGQFRYLPSLFMYLPCFDLPASTVVDRGKPVKIGNVSLIWTAPDAESGDIRFVASVLKGIHYWIIVSNILQFNPFPISTYGCGSTLACFRVCALGAYPCGARDALYIFSYNVDFRDKREIQFTMGGKLPNNNTYLAVAFGDDYNGLVQADLTVCYLDRGRAKIEHLLIENLLLPPYSHNEVNEIIELDDYDLDGNMLWCRFRRPINPITIINPRTTLFHFYFWGTMDYYYQRFILPRRHRIFSSAFKRNFSTPINEIVNTSWKHAPAPVVVLLIIALSSVFITRSHH